MYDNPGAALGFLQSPAGDEFMRRQAAGGGVQGPLPSDALVAQWRPETVTDWASPAGRAAINQWHMEKFGVPAEFPGGAQTTDPRQAVAQAAGETSPARGGYQNPAEGGSPFRPLTATIDRTYGGLGGAGLGSDPFSQGVSTLGKMPTPQEMESRFYVNEAPALPGTREYESQMNRLAQGRQAAAAAYNSLLGKYIGGSEQANKAKLGAGDLALRQQLGLGRLGIEQQAEDRLGAMDRYKLSPAGRIDALVSAWNQNPAGAPPALEQEKRIRDIIGIESQIPGREPLSRPGSQTPMPGATGSPAIYPGALSGAPTPWAGIEKTLEQVAYDAQKPAQDGKGKVAPSIGEFLSSLDNAHPGMIRDNADAVMGWLRNKYGEQNFQTWFQTPNMRRSPLSALIGQSPKHSVDEQMRSALQNLMAERGNPVKSQSGSIVGRLLQPLGEAVGINWR